MKAPWLVGRVLGVGIVVLLLGGCGDRKPDIEVASRQYDFGQIEQGELVTAEIPVRNLGEKELKIESVATSCGCTSAEVQPEVMPPGSEGRLLIRYNSGAHPDKGRIRRHIYIASNDPDELEVEVIITADVRPPPQ